MSLTLHFHPLASYCWKALIALYENDTAFTPNLVDLGSPAERAALVKLWGIGKFPVLRDEARNETVPESSIIVEYLDRHYRGPTRFIPDDFGSADLAGSLIPHGLIDEFRIALNPIILGGGKPLFKPGEKLKLKLIDSRPLSTGIVILRYVPSAAK